jgi:hypothetical protein
MNKKLALAIATCALSSGVLAKSYKYKDLCAGDKTFLKGLSRLSFKTPVPNYNNPLIKQIVKKLNQVDSSSFYLYRDIEKVYGLCSGSKKNDEECRKQNNIPEDVSTDAHNFITIACGEFRDNPEMLLSKLQWTSRMNIAKDEKQTYDPAKGVWEQLTGPGYEKLVDISESLYFLRTKNIENTDSRLTVDQRSVPAMSACEYRYILARYLATDWRIRNSEDLSQYEEGYNTFKRLGVCKQSELDNYYEFRGDGNFKPLSLESNAMIWNARLFSKNCTSTGEAKKGTTLTDKDCKRYYKKPFRTRYNLSKEGFKRLFYYPMDFDDKMKAYKKELVFVTDDVNGDGISDMIVLDDVDRSAGEFDGKSAIKNARSSINTSTRNRQWNLRAAYQKLVAYLGIKAVIPQLKEKKVKTANIEEVLKRSEEGLKTILLKLKESRWADKEAKVAIENAINAKKVSGIKIITEVMGDLKKKEYNNAETFSKLFSDKKDAWDRIATVLDRHTDWYKTDMLNLSLGQYMPTYSPWVASSYYINKSDAFTVAGYAMNNITDWHKHWMFIQKVPKSRWFKAEDMNEKWPYDVDIFNMWFDETTFSRSHLGADEQGWDRFGTAAADEMGEIVYLYHADEY